MSRLLRCFIFFFFNDAATTEIYTLSLHDALPISGWTTRADLADIHPITGRALPRAVWWLIKTKEKPRSRSEEHTSELQSQSNLVCRLLLEKKKKKKRQ